MSSGFITEAEIEEKKRLRQLEWERVRKPEEPLEVPPEPVDNRSLFERLQEQKNKKQEEFEEAHKLKNLVKTLDDDEVLFLDQVDQDKIDEERRRRLEEARELNEFRTAVSQLREKEIDKAIHHEIGLTEKPSRPKPAADASTVSIGLARTSQSKLISGIVKRKYPSTSQNETGDVNVKDKKLKDDTTSNPSEAESKAGVGVIPSVPYKGSLVCIGVIPGLASYDNSDDEEGNNDEDSDSDDHDDCHDCDSHQHGHDVRDLCGRKIEYEHKDDSK